MIFGRLILRFLIVPFGVLAAIVVAVLVVIMSHWNRFTALAAADAGTSDEAMVALLFAGPAIALVLAMSAVAMMLPATLGVLVSEALAIRSWIFHAANGAISAWVGWGTMVDVREPYDFYSKPAVVVGAGIAAGLMYWLVAGWNAGFWKPVFAPAPAASRPE